jgi:hypothetical protein
MHKGITLSAAVQRIPDGSSLMIDRARQMVQTYLAECAVDSGDSRTAELNEVIGNCVGWMSDNHREHGQQALRYALGYVDEHSYASASDDWVDGRLSG